MIAAFLLAAREPGQVEREELLRAVIRSLGFKRMGARIEEHLRNHMRAAIRRRIIAANGKLVGPDTKSLDDYSIDELRDALVNPLRRGQRTDRESAVRAATRSLGFSRLIVNMRETMRSAVNSAIRQKPLDYEGADEIWRT